MNIVHVSGLGVELVGRVSYSLVVFIALWSPGAGNAGRRPRRRDTTIDGGCKGADRDDDPRECHGSDTTNRTERVCAIDHCGSVSVQMFPSLEHPHI